jgi:Mg2+/Co2+ transporter CorB
MVFREKRRNGSEVDSQAQTDGTVSLEDNLEEITAEI